MPSRCSFCKQLLRFRGVSEVKKINYNVFICFGEVEVDEIIFSVFVNFYKTEKSFKKVVRKSCAKEALSLTTTKK